MEKKIDAVKLMRKIRTKLAEKYLKSRDEELKELKEKFVHLYMPATADKRFFLQKILLHLIV
ncbi:MAG: hypothetical protein ACUVUQ_11045 [Thermodesulfovibrionales bacterium]